MTVDEIRNMPVGRPLDILVAEKVMGQTWQGGNPIPNYDGRYPWPPPYSTDIAAAWQVMERLCKSELENATGNANDGASQLDFFAFPIPGKWCCSFWTADGETVGSAEAETAPLAICCAALIAMEARP